MSRNVRPFILVGILLMLWPVVASAQGRRHGEGGGRPVVIVGGHVGSPFYDPFVYDPFWGPYAWGPYGYAYANDNAEVRVLAMPKDAEVFVDGYYAGVVDNFNGAFQRLNVRPGGHEFVLYRDGFQTVHQTLYLQPGSTFKLQDTMLPLAPGQTMEPRPVPAAAMAGPPIEPRSGPRTPRASQPGMPIRPGSPGNTE